MEVAGLDRIVVGVDGSPQAAGAMSWAIALARTTGANVVAVFAHDPAPLAYTGFEVAPPVPYDERIREELKAAFETEWCAPLRDSGVGYHTVFRQGRPAQVIAEVADQVDADLVVVGRRGRGPVAELLLGSVSHELSHHCRRPVLLISEPVRQPGSVSVDSAARTSSKTPLGPALSK